MHNHKFSVIFFSLACWSKLPFVWMCIQLLQLQIAWAVTLGRVSKSLPTPSSGSLCCSEGTVPSERKSCGQLHTMPPPWSSTTIYPARSPSPWLIKVNMCRLFHCCVWSHKLSLKRTDDAVGSSPCSNDVNDTCLRWSKPVIVEESILVWCIQWGVLLQRGDGCQGVRKNLQDLSSQHF